MTGVAARIRFGGAVGVQGALLGHLGEPEALLVGRGAEEYGVAAEERREDAGGHADVDAGHLLAHPVDIDRSAAHPAVLLGNEQQLDAQLVTAHAPDNVLWAHIVVI
jgi:hypothetical protein